MLDVGTYNNKKENSFHNFNKLLMWGLEGMNKHSNPFLIQRLKGFMQLAN